MTVKNKILILLIIAILFTSGISMADNKIDYTQTKGSLTIIKKAKEADKDIESAKPLAGVTFRIYKVDDDATDITDTVISKYTEIEGWDYSDPSNNSGKDQDGSLYATEKITGVDGEAKFENLPLGRYFVKEMSAPANVKGKIEPFLIDIPYTEQNGTSLNYNPVVTPKNVISYAKVTLTKKGNDDDLLKGVQFDLEKNKSGDVWEKITDKGTLETNASGEIVIEGLDLGKYRLIETSLGEDSSVQGYILDNSKVYDFEVTAVDGEISVDHEKIEVVNEKPTIEKVIEEITVNELSDHAKTDLEKKSANIGDKIKYKVTISVPKVIDKLETFKLTDVLNENLKLDSTTIEVVATKREEAGITEKLQADEAYTLNSSTETSYEIDFTDKNSLVDYSKIDITYSAEIKEGAEFVSGGYANNATLTYSNVVKNKYDSSTNDSITNSEAKKSISIATGGFKILKKANSESGEGLKGAEFKIADSLDNAKQGIFIKNSKGQEIVITSEDEGKGGYLGLSFGDYWLVETQAPKVDESGDKYYNLLKEPVAITIDENSYNDENATKIVNKKGTILPETGGVGTLIFTVSGIALIAIGVIIYKKNKKDEE